MVYIPTPTPKALGTMGRPISSKSNSTVLLPPPGLFSSQERTGRNKSSEIHESNATSAFVDRFIGY